MRIDFHKRFDKEFFNLSTQSKQRFKERLIVFTGDPYNSTLNKHSLKGKYKGYRSINIEGNFRAIYIPLSKIHVEFAYIGTHAQLYK